LKYLKLINKQEYPFSDVRQEEEEQEEEEEELLLLQRL